MAMQCPKITLRFNAVDRHLTECSSVPCRAMLSQVNLSSCNTMKSLDRLRVYALSGGEGSGSGKKAAAPNSNYVVPLDKSPSMTRPLAEILRDLNKRIPDNIIKARDEHSTFIPWFQANRMLSFYAPGWCGEIRDVIFSDNGTVTVVYRVTIRGSDGEAHRESTGTVSIGDGNVSDHVAAAEEIAFCGACARFGLGLYLYREE